MNRMAPIKSPRAGRPTKEQAEARQAALLDCAMKHFLDKGFEQTTLEAIAADMNMTKRTIYARYPSKEDLFHAALRRCVEQNAVPLADIEAARTRDLAETLINIAKQRINLVSTAKGLALQRLIETESFRFPDIFGMTFDIYSKPTVMFLKRLFEEETAAGSLNLREPELAATTFMSMVVGGPVRFITSGNPLTDADLDKRVAFAVNLFLEGARAR